MKLRIFILDSQRCKRFLVVLLYSLLNITSDERSAVRLTVLALYLFPDVHGKLIFKTREAAWKAFRGLISLLSRLICLVLKSSYPRVVVFFLLYFASRGLF